MVSLLLFWWYGKKEMGHGEEGKGGGRVTQVMYHGARSGWGVTSIYFISCGIPVKRANTFYHLLEKTYKEVFHA